MQRSTDWPGVLRLAAKVLVVLATILGTLLAEDGSVKQGSPEPEVAQATPTPAATAAPTPDTSEPAGELASTGAQVEELRDDTPASVPDGVLERADAQAEQQAERMDLPPPRQDLPVGGAQGYACKPYIASRGYGFPRTSSLFVLHYTVSRNVPGWSDVYAIADYLERVGLSATYVMDFEGNCLQTVPTANAPYTQGFYNSYAESVEIIAYGDESTAQWQAAPIIKDGILASLVRDRLQARGLPLRFVNPEGCGVPTGYTDHNSLECGNDHHDVTPAFPYAVFARQVSVGPRVKITKQDRSTCAKVVRYRKRRKGDDKSARREARKKANQTRHQHRVRDLHARGLYCTSSGATKRK